MQDPIVCPFCPLHCDDVVLRDNDIVNVDCDVAAKGFRAVIQSASARLGEQSVPLSELTSFVRQLNLPAIPVVEIGWLSIEQAKRLQRLSDRIAIQRRGRDTVHEQTVARDGLDSATLADIKNHADIVFAVGNFETTPRLLDRLSSVSATMHVRESISAEELAMLRSGDPNAHPVFRALIDSRYAAIVVGDNAYESGSEVVCAESLHRFVRERNGQAVEETGACRRAVLLRLDPHQNVKSVFRWRTNESVGDGSLPSTTQTMVDIRLGDALKATQVKLQIGGSDPGAETAEAYLPAASIGIHQRGTTLRGDGSVCLPLGAPFPSEVEDAVDRLSLVIDSLSEAV